METAEYHSSEYCVMPQMITSETIFNGWQYYQTTMHLLGITERDDLNIWVGRRTNEYNNAVFKGIIAYETSMFYGSILAYAKVKRKEYFSCNGLCEPKRSTQILDIYKETQAFCKKEYFGQYDVERYMYERIYGKLKSV